MKITSIDPIQSELISFAGSSPLTIASDCSIEKFYHSLCHILYQNLDQFKKSVIVCDPAEIESLLKWLGKEKLSKYVLILDKNQSFSEKERARLRIWAKNLKQHKPKTQFDALRTNLLQKEEAIRDSIVYLQRKIFGERNWMNIADLNGYSQLTHAPQMTHQPAPENFEFSEDEYWLIKGRIKQLKNGYEKEFTDLFNQFQFNPSTFQGEEKIVQIIGQLNDFSSQIKNSWLDLQKFIERFRHKQFSQWNEKFVLLMNSLNELKLLEAEYRAITEYNYGSKSIGLSIPFYSTNKKSKELDRVKNQITEGFSLLLNNCVEYGLVSRSNSFPALSLNTPIDEISEQLVIIEQAFSGFKKLIDTEISKVCNRINKYNSTENKLIEIEEKIESLIIEINKSQIFKYTVEENALSSIKKQGFLLHLYKQISGARDLLIKKVQFGHWIQRLANMPEKVKLVFQMLGSIPVNQWLDTFDAWYFKQAAFNKLELSFLNLEKDVNGLLHNLSNFRDSLPNKFEDTWMRKRALAVERLARKDKKLYLQLFKKNTLPELSWPQLLYSHFSFITDVYPIVVINREVINDYKIPGESSWDTGIKYPSEPFQNNDLSWILKYSVHTVSFTSSSVEEVADLKIDGKKIEEDVPVIPQLPELVEFDKEKLNNSSNRLLFAKTISKHIIQITRSCQIFQLKDQIILSFLSKSKNKLFIKYLKNQGIKELNPNESIELTLQDSLIDLDRQLLVFTQFGLINYQSLDSLEWQMVVLDYLKKHGATIHSLSPEDDLFEWGNYIRKICHSISKPKDPSLITSS